MINNPTAASPVLECATDIVVAQISSHSMGNNEVIHFIQTVYQTLSDLESGVSETKQIPATQGPSVPIEDSVQDDYIICLEDGKKLKILKRYLKTNFNMTPEQYRRKWNLPSDYPMVAPAYAAQRSKLAKKLGSVLIQGAKLKAELKQHNYRSYL